MNLKLTLRHFGGSGPLLVLGPSLGTSVENLWRTVANRLTDRFRIVGWELPGHGGAPAGTVESVADLAAGVTDALRSSGESSEYHYAGDSLGGAVGLHLLLGSAPPITATLISTGARIGTAQSWTDRAAAVRAEGTGALLSAAPGRWFGPGFADAHPDVAQALLDDLRQADDTSYAALCEALASHDVRADLYRISAPVLAVAGENDTPTPPRDLRRIATGVQHGRLIVLDGIGHLAPAENPGEVAALITAHAAARPAKEPSRAQVRAQGMRVRREVLGDDWVDAASAATDEVTAEFQDLITRYAWGEIWTRPGLDRRARSIVTLTVLVARGHHEELAAHLLAARRNGLTDAEIVEVLLQTAVYCGVPDANTAFRIARRVLAIPADAEEL